MADDCCNSFGGRVSIAIDGVRYTPSEADITLQPANREVTAQANQDGSAAFMAKPRLPSADIKFRNNCGIAWSELLLKCKIDATIEEEDNGRTHMFTAARITGTPEVNLSSGEVSGMKIEGPNYKALAA
ncbi:phage tail tube protein [Xanthobacteraceae bacterium Astr-EGSB]|uniref:phage tail tube protein n=1 Tax=Astrobacterium formosum TaxID=3069710 RepID=UPI0027B39823|nr:phage tail tube protein [Xanthobacteraceae bacterium Astr-EGSB]